MLSECSAPKTGTFTHTQSNQTINLGIGYIPSFLVITMTYSSDNKWLCDIINPGGNTLTVNSVYNGNYDCGTKSKGDIINPNFGNIKISNGTNDIVFWGNTTYITAISGGIAYRWYAWQ